MAQHPNEPLPASYEDRSGEDLPLVELETLLNRPPSWRKRLAHIGLVLATAVIILVMFWGNIVSHKPVAPPALPNPNALLILSNVNYGAVTINGKKQPWSPPMMMPIHGNTS